MLREELRKTQLELQREREASASHQMELTVAKEALAAEKQKVKKLWHEQCDQLLAHEELLDEKDGEIRKLKAELAALRASRSPVVLDNTVQTVAPYKPLSDLSTSRRASCETPGRINTVMTSLPYHP